MSRFEPREPLANLADEVTAVLVARIASGELKPGDRLAAEKDLAIALQVSRSVIREAVSRLKHDGLLETRQGSGAFVAGFGSAKSFRLRLHTPEDLPLADIFELRGAVEAGAAFFAAERRGEADLDRIAEAVDAIDVAMADGRDGVAEDKSLHLAIALASGNAAFVRFLDFVAHNVDDAIRAARINSLKVPGRPHSVQLEHRKVVDAIRAADAMAAHTAMASHIRAAAHRLGVAR